MTLRHLGFTLGEIGRTITAYVSFVVTMMVVAVALIAVLSG